MDDCPPLVYMLFLMNVIGILLCGVCSTYRSLSSPSCSTSRGLGCRLPTKSTNPNAHLNKNEDTRKKISTQSNFSQISAVSKISKRGERCTYPSDETNPPYVFSLFHQLEPFIINPRCPPRRSLDPLSPSRKSSYTDGLKRKHSVSETGKPLPSSSRKRESSPKKAKPSPPKRDKESVSPSLEVFIKAHEPNHPEYKKHDEWSPKVEMITPQAGQAPNSDTDMICLSPQKDSLKESIASKSPEKTPEKESERALEKVKSPTSPESIEHLFKTVMPGMHPETTEIAKRLSGTPHKLEDVQLFTIVDIEKKGKKYHYTRDTVVETYAPPTLEVPPQKKNRFATFVSPPKEEQFFKNRSPSPPSNRLTALKNRRPTSYAYVQMRSPSPASSLGILSPNAPSSIVELPRKESIKKERPLVKDPSPIAHLASIEEPPRRLRASVINPSPITHTPIEEPLSNTVLDPSPIACHTVEPKPSRPTVLDPSPIARLATLEEPPNFEAMQQEPIEKPHLKTKMDHPLSFDNQLIQSPNSVNAPVSVPPEPTEQPQRSGAMNEPKPILQHGSTEPHYSGTGMNDPSPSVQQPAEVQHPGAEDDISPIAYKPEKTLYRATVIDPLPITHQAMIDEPAEEHIGYLVRFKPPEDDLPSPIYNKSGLIDGKTKYPLSSDTPVANPKVETKKLKDRSDDSDNESDKSSIASETEGKGPKNEAKMLELTRADIGEIPKFETKTIIRPPETLPPPGERLLFYDPSRASHNKKKDLELSDAATPEITCCGIVSKDKLINEKTYKSPFKKKTTAVEQTYYAPDVIKPIPSLVKHKKKEEEQPDKPKSHSTKSEEEEGTSSYKQV